MGEELFVSGLVGPYRIFQRKNGHCHGIDDATTAYGPKTPMLESAAIPMVSPRRIQKTALGPGHPGAFEFNDDASFSRKSKTEGIG